MGRERGPARSLVSVCVGSCTEEAGVGVARSDEPMVQYGRWIASPFDLSHQLQRSSCQAAYHHVLTDHPESSGYH